VFLEVQLADDIREERDRENIEHHPRKLNAKVHPDWKERVSIARLMHEAEGRDHSLSFLVLKQMASTVLERL
jgi:hypothetical protein